MVKSCLTFTAIALLTSCSSTSEQPTSTATGPSSTSAGGRGGSAGSSATGRAGGGTGGSGGGGAGGSGGGGAGGSSSAEAGSDGPPTPGDAAIDAPSFDASQPDDVTIADAGDDSAPPAAPPTLSATGFFKAIGADGGFDLADGVRPYQPRFALWADGASKARWVYLPPNTTIDNSDQDHWSFPVGAKFWKEFSINGNRIETRLIERFGPGPDDYLYATYHWKAVDAGGLPNDAVLVPPNMRVLNANGTEHDTPYELHCHTCHDPLKEHVLGFSAFQLTPAAADAGATGVTIRTLSTEGRLRVPTPNGFAVPGNTAAIRDALSYLHANCGNCHNDTPGIAIPNPKMNLRLLVAQTTAQQTGAYTTALNVATTKEDHAPEHYAWRIFGGDATKSALSWRMGLRNTNPDVPAEDQMPPLATEHPDMAALTVVNTWIRSLPPPPDR